MVIAKQTMLMKKILLFASAALLFAGCAKENITPIENPDNSQKGDITLSFSASQTGFGTKAVIGETTGEGTSKSTAINWQSTDKISVFDGANKNCQFSTKNFSTETTTSCTFEGNVNAVATDYTAVYPYTEGAKIIEGVISGVTLPAIQTAVAGSFDSSAALMAAKTVSGGRDLAFKNLVGYVKVATDLECKKIELCAASGEKLAGVGTISFNEGGTPSFTLSDGAESTITLLPEGEGTTIAAGTYYIAVPAKTLAAGWSIRLTDTDDIVSTKKGSKDITFKQSTILNLGPISKIEPRYLTFSAESEQTFTMNFQPDKAAAFTLGNGEYFEYRVGNDQWNKFTETKSVVSFGGAGKDLQLRGISSKGTAVSDYTQWTTISFGKDDAKVSCSGDIRTLVNYKDYENANTSNARFCNLFNNCLQLTSAPDLPATELASKCYYCMFENCKSLTTAPAELPAKTLAEKCYESMFAFCSSLTSAPAKLPAEALAERCYYGMFCECSKLANAPDLPATTLADECYRDMFSGCTALTKAPELPAETLAAYCYYGMFCGCSKLTTAPALPATTLAPGCYQEMFSGCSALSSVTMLATDVSADMCLEKWLDEAGTNVQGAAPTLTLYNFDVYNKILEQNNNGYNYLPEEWKSYNIRYKYE